MPEKKRLIVIDSLSVIHRAYHALPPLTTKKGELINAVYGFLLVFLKANRDFQPDYIAAAFDVSGPTFRHAEFREYKNNRPAVPRELSSQIPKVKKVLKAFGIPVFEKKEFEADDIIGTIAKIVDQKNQAKEGKDAEQSLPKIETIILSGDSDTFQLINEATKVYALRKGLKDTVLQDKEAVQRRYGIDPSQLVDFRALSGDATDNIPGVPGIGEKTALRLIQAFGSLEKLYKTIDQEPLPETDQNEIGQRFRSRLLEHREKAFLSRELVRIRQNVEIDFDVEKCIFSRTINKKAIRALQDLGFHSLVKKIS